MLWSSRGCSGAGWLRKRREERREEESQKEVSSSSRRGFHPMLKRRRTIATDPKLGPLEDERRESIPRAEKRSSAL